MEILAKIPDLAAEPSPPPIDTARPVLPVASAAPKASAPSAPAASFRPPQIDAAITPAAPSRPGRRRATHRPRFPTGSIVMLAVVAGLVWTAVTWRERASLLRKSPPERWSEAFASEPAGDDAGRLR
jgi:hypothetical protein